MAQTALQIPINAPITPAQQRNMSAANLQLLSSINPIEKQPEARKPSVKKNKTLAALASAYKEFYKAEWHEQNCEQYNRSLALASALKITQQGISEFLVFLKAYEHKPFFEDSGIFISALLNGSPEEKLSIDLRIFDRATLLNNIGANNCKDLIVYGDLGSYAAHGMKGGTLTVHGNIGTNAACHMKGGKFLLHGNAGDSAALEMIGGLFIIEGDAGSYEGIQMKGGTLHINGNLGERRGYASEGGDIYHKGIRIVVRGTRLI